jgi:hypothetical protein
VDTSALILAGRIIDLLQSSGATGMEAACAISAASAVLPSLPEPEEISDGPAKS